MNAAPEVSIVHRDAHLLVLHKPSGLPTTAPKASGQAPDCLTARAATLDPDAPRLHATSRLDAEVSGLVTFARTKRGNDALMGARAEGTYGRLYIALTTTPPPLALAERVTWDWPIGVHPKDKRKRVARVGAPRAGDKAARSTCEVACRLPAGALLHLRPQTGRTHQLRVHALQAGAGLLGDRVYGAPTRATLPDGRVVTARRTMLHCAALRLPDVAGAGAPLLLRATPPTDFIKVFTGLGGDADDPRLLRADP